LSEISKSRISPEALNSFCSRVFVKSGLPEEDARTAAEVLVASDMRGIESHGAARLNSYVEMIQKERFNARPNFTVIRETASTALVDGDNGLGLVIGPKANRLAMDKAEDCGSGWVTVRNSNHFGIAGYYPIQALERDLIGISMTNASPIVTPTYGKGRRIGTNPIAFACPGKEEPPIVIDMATSAAPFGKLEMAMLDKKPIPEGWAVDNRGLPTTNPHDFLEGGALVPLGSNPEQSSHKGFCLAVMVDMLTAVLSGANWGPFVPPFRVPQDPIENQPGKGLGHFFGALRIDGFTDVDTFKEQVDGWIRTFRATPAADGTPGVIIPGDPEREAEEDRRKHGIPFHQEVIDDLREVAGITGVNFDF